MMLPSSGEQQDSGRFSFGKWSGALLAAVYSPWAAVATRRSPVLLVLLLLVSIDSPRLVADAAAGRDPAPAPVRQTIYTQAAQVRALSPDLIPSARLHLIGTITYYDPSNNIMFLQDASGGIFINIDRPYPVHTGDLVEVDGRPNDSYRVDVNMNPRITVLGKGHMPEAPLLRYEDLAVGRGDSRRVTIRGRVRAADVGQHQDAPSVHLDIVMPDGEVELYVASSVAFRPDSMLDATIEATGVGGGAFDKKWQLSGIILYVPSPADIRILHPPAVSARALPLLDIDEVFQSRRVTDTSTRVRVRGVLTYYKKGYSAVLERDGKSIYVQTLQTSNLVIGDVVDAFGFANDSQYAPSLGDASIFKVGGREQIAPRPATYDEALSGLYSDNLISLSGILVSELHDVGSDTLVVDVNGHLVNAYLEDSAPLQNLDLGSRIRVAGICRVLRGGPWQVPYVFHLEMRTIADVQVLSKPSWWTIRHLIELLGALLVLSIAIAIWALWLRRRVVHQKGHITRSMLLTEERSRVLKLISSNESPELLLTQICDSVTRLLPGTTCSYFLYSDLDGARREAAERMPENPLFEVGLPGIDEQALGKIYVTAPKNYVLLNDHHDVCAMLSELATLAIQQSMLYKGLVHHSTHDPLTELPNRRLCEHRLASALQQAELQGSHLAVIYIDVNCFKHVNDKYGHKTGDSYLKQISARLLTEIRSGDTLARIGGDEFLVIAPLSAHGDVDTLTDRLKTCFDKPFHIDGEWIDGSASFGVARYPEHGTTAEELTRNADHAMYFAKRNLARATGEVEELSIVTPEELALAVRRDQFRLAYQPQFSSSGKLTGLEALLRLQDPILGLLTPDAFISVAERSDVILDIGAWVLKRALQDAIRWELHTGTSMVMAVNVSVRQVEQPGFSDLVLDVLNEVGFPAGRLELELTERSFFSESEEAKRQLGRIREAGVRISLDDFGTGQSCLSVLHKLPVDTIKLDRSFIVAMDDEPAVLPIIQAIVSMAQSLGKRIVAEGVEHTGPVRTLLAMGDVEFQGYLFGRPVPGIEVDQVIETWRRGVEMPDIFGGGHRLRREEGRQDH